MSFVQKLLKLRKISIDELRVRTRAHMQLRRDQLQYSRRSATGHIRSTADLLASNLSDNCLDLVPGARASELKRLAALDARFYFDCESRAASRAANVLSDSIDLLGFRFKFPANLDWHADPRTEYCWPRQFFASLKLYELDDQVDVKYVWELGRHQFLVDLARGWLFTNDGRYADRVRSYILDWIEQNAVFEGVHWTSGLEVAIRATSWLWSIACLSGWNGWQRDDLATIVCSLAEHASYLENHFSFYSSPYNHLIGEATGLYLIALSLPQWKESDRWRSCARKILETHGPKQFHSDGFNVEQATGYHFFTLGFLAQALVAARREGQPLEAVESIAHRAFRAGAALRQPDERWAAIGDVDSARAIPVYHEDFWNFTSLCSLGAALFQDPALRPRGTTPGEENYWLLGCKGIETLQHCSSDRSDSCAALPDSGYAVGRHKNDWLLFDAGPIAAGLYSDTTPSAAHGHADALQVLYCVDGQPVLVDPGMSRYGGSRDWVDYFREAEAHNTVVVDGISMAQTAGRLAWSHVQRRPQLDVNLSNQAWLARGRVRWDSCGDMWDTGVLVERYLFGIPGRGLWIADWIETDRPRRVRWFWQLAAGLKIQIKNANAPPKLVESAELVLITWSNTADIRVGIEKSTDGSPVGWHAPGYGALRSAQRVCCESEVARHALTVTYVGKNPSTMEVAIRDEVLLCDPYCQCDLVPPLNQDDSRSDVRWRIPTEEGYRTYSAGCSSATKDSRTVQLSGIGQWPAYYQSFSHANALPHAHFTSSDTIR